MPGPALELAPTRLVMETIEADRAGWKVIAHEGSSGSSKTFSIAQCFAVWAEIERAKTYSVVRATMPAMKKGALRDWQTVLDTATVDGEPAALRYDVNRTDLVWTHKVTGTRVEFFALDGAAGQQKARGPRRDRLWPNEANELGEPVFDQLAMRTRGLIVMDYNPSAVQHWIYDDVLTRPDCLRIHSTYKDNPYLSPEEVREIEKNVPVYEEADGSRVVDWGLTYTGKGRMISGDPYLWAVFGRGERGSPTNAIYPRHEIGDFPGDAESVVGIDFGFTNPTVVARVARLDVEPRPRLHVDQLIHAPGLTTADLIDRLPDAGVTKRDRIYADAEDARTIEEVRRAGYRIQAAKKGPGSVFAGIMWIKGHDLVFTRRSSQMRTEFAGYRWDGRPNGTPEDRPVKQDDHGPDSVRYASEHWRTPRYDYSRP